MFNTLLELQHFELECINGTIGTEFVKLLPTGNVDIINCKNHYYTIDAITKFKIYENTLNDIKLDLFDNSKINDTDYVCNYMKAFCWNIFENISKINYPGENYIPPRRNHGGLNHMRSLLFGINIIKIILESDKYKKLSLQQKEIFSPKPFFIMLMLSTMFESIMRIDESGSYDVLCELSESYYKKLYPGLDYNTLSKSGLSPHQLASSILYKILMERCFQGVVDKDKIIELSRGVSYYWDSKNDSINIKNKNIEELAIGNPDGNFLQFFIYYVIIIVGHYLDHCRGGAYFSAMIENDDIKKLLDLFEISQKIRIDMVELIVRTLRATEFTSYSGPDINSTKMKDWCRNLQHRYDHPDFNKLSLNFEDCWTKLMLDEIIKKTISIYDK